MGRVQRSSCWYCPGYSSWKDCFRSRRRPERVSGEFHTGTTSDPQRMEIETCRIYKESYKEQMDAQLDAMKMAFMRMAGLGGD